MSASAFNVGDVVRHRLGLSHERVIEIEYFSEKDGRRTAGGPVIDTTERDVATPERGWTYVDAVIEVVEDAE